MGFTTPCFIHKNTEELRKKLEEFGYLFIPNGWNEWSIPIENCEYLLCDTDTYQGYYISYYTGKVCKPNFGIDCMENEELFLAIAAKRDDTSDNQYWVFDEDFHKWKKGDFVIGRFGRCSCYCHVATVEELIEHFK